MRIAILMLMLVGCAQSAEVPTYHADVAEPEFRTLFVPIVDVTTEEQRKALQGDVLACNALAEQYQGQALSSAMWNGILGAAVGAVIGEHMGDAGKGAEVAGETAAITGAAQGMGETALGQRDIVDRCLRYRGHPVLAIQPKATPVLIMPMK